MGRGGGALITLIDSNLSTMYFLRVAGIICKIISKLEHEYCHGGGRIRIV